MSYDFRISNEKWLEANKEWLKSNEKKDRVLCAHCCLENLGLNVWNITKDKDTAFKIIHLELSYYCVEDFLKSEIIPKTKLHNPLPKDARLIHIKIDSNHQSMHLFYESETRGTELIEGQLLEEAPITEILFESNFDSLR